MARFKARVAGQPVEPLEDGQRAQASNRAGLDRREQIIAAARRRFADIGYDATTMRQIAGDVKLLAGSLYHHFATKEELLHEIVRDPIERLRARAETIAARLDPVEHRLVALIFADVEEMTNLREVHAILHQERAFFRRSDDFAYVREARRLHYLVWRRLIEEGIEQGAFDDSINVHLTISTSIRILNTGAEWFIDDEELATASGINQLEDLCIYYTRFVLRAIRTADRIRTSVPLPAYNLD